MSSRKANTRNKTPRAAASKGGPHSETGESSSSSSSSAAAPPVESIDDKIQQFVAITGSPVEVADSMLKACNGNLQIAIDLFLDDAQSVNNSMDTEASGPSMVDSDGVRAPIPQRTEVMVEPSHNQPAYRFARKREANSIFDSLRDFQAETREMEQGISGFTDKKRTLQELFRPPIDILYKGSFRSASITAENQNRWLLVNIQNSQEFSCQVLNRDIWSMFSVKEYIKKSFVFWQGYNDSTDGSQYVQYYHINSWPHVAILDPRTGEAKLILQNMTPDNIMNLLKEFIYDNPSLDPAIDTHETIVIDDDNILDSSEDKQLMEAIRLSLQDGKGASTSHAGPSSSAASTSAAAMRASAVAASSAAAADYSDEELEAETFTSDDDSRSSFAGSKAVPTKISQPGPASNGVILNGPTVTLQFRYPNGQKKQLTLPKASQLQALIDDTEASNYSSEKFELITTFPRRKLSELDPTRSLLDIGLDSQEVIYVQSI